jgi:hypothetical protein
MKKVLIAGMLVLGTACTVTPANAQREPQDFFLSPRVYPNPHPGYARAINISPRTGRPYDSTNYALPCWTKSQAAARLKVFGQRVPRLCK